MLCAEVEVASVLAEVEEEWTRPDMVMKLALSVAMMPPEALPCWTMIRRTVLRRC